MQQIGIEMILQPLQYLNLQQMRTQTRMPMRSPLRHQQFLLLHPSIVIMSKLIDHEKLLTRHTVVDGVCVDAA